MSGRQQYSEILWEVFEYCLELVNASKSNVTAALKAAEQQSRLTLQLPKVITAL